MRTYTGALDARNAVHRKFCTVGLTGDRLPEADSYAEVGLLVSKNDALPKTGCYTISFAD